jgi:hygromycin-B 4-O-kinase
MESSIPSAAAVQDFLYTRFGGRATHIREIGRGEWSQAYSYRLDGRDYVIRFSRFQEDFFKDQRAYNFKSPDLPVPHITEVGEVFDGFYAISERVFGEPIDHLTGAEWRRIMSAFFRMLDAIRDANIAASHGYGTWGADGSAGHSSWRAYLLSVGDDRPARGTCGWPNRIHDWRPKLARFPDRERAFNEAVTDLSALVGACPEERYLVHSDLLNNNVLVADGGIAAVLDWGCSKYGDFLYDVAWYTLWSPWYPGLTGIDLRQEALRHYQSINLEVPSFAERLRCYEIHIGLESQVYNSFKERWDLVDEVAQRLLAIRRS